MQTMKLLDRLPHKAPALLLGEVLELAGDSATCALAQDLHPSLAHEGLLPAPLALEAMAQCAAVWMIGTHPEAEARGMLVQCRNFEMECRYIDPADGIRVICRPVSTGSGTGLSLFAAELRDREGKRLCSANLMILTRGAAE